ncbi:hypothetical protein N9153_00230 [Planctomicrobium sp.]|jgi:streptogramin lyase|nr:hypothetical protein [Planctomicrobium sp.]
MKSTTSFFFVTSCLFFQMSHAAEVVNVAGTGVNTYSGDGGPANLAAVGNPFGVVIGPDDALYICEVSNHVIRRIDRKTGLISTVAGTGEKGYSGDGGPATSAKLNEPYEVRFSKNGDMYFVEMQNAIVRKVDSKSGIISTIAGNVKHGFGGDGGPATQAQLHRPHSIVFDQNDQLYICDIGNHRIRIVHPKTGIIKTFAGTGEKKKTPDGAQVSGTPLNGPRALDFDGKQSLILALREGNALYRIDLKTETLHHLAGTGRKGYSQSSPAKQAELSGPKGVAIDTAGDIYFADTESHTVRVYRAKSKMIETVVGNGLKGDGPAGNPLNCQLARPHGVCVDEEGNVYIGDSEAHRVRVLKLE